ncbi:MAG: DedA family protein [Candidatus Nanopelagicales bacterium]|jgi:membrane-associated protein|nr:DedA family protein [Candidatus Nanopelagicales bacterium]MDP4666393.1 DedA family protein [Candidatus Nanopelagicales bacterium]MDP4896014.1 DedA family protein [Candidatus Nanopelagicales bacterium]MDP5050096.1 DedA family protein [Candidatus Nanopelagicales bacterium]
MDSVFLAAALTGQVTDWLNSYGPVLFYLIVWGLVFAGTGLLIGAFIPFITGDSLIFAAGVLAATNDSIEIRVLTIGIGLAAFVGDQTGFVLGRHFGRPYLDKREGPKLKSAIAKSEKFYQQLGWWAVVVSRFMPWARVLVPAIAGIARMNYYKFLGANFVGAISWGVGLSLAGYYAATIPAVKTGSYAIATFFIVGSIVAGLRSWVNNRKTA